MKTSVISYRKTTSGPIHWCFDIHRSNPMKEYAGLSFCSVFALSRRRAVFAALLVCLPVLWVETSDALAITSQASQSNRVLVVTGDTAPIAGLTTTFGNVGHSIIADSGDIAFLASLDDINGSGSSIWTARADQLQLITRKGDLAPGTESGVRFDGFQNPAVNSFGHVSFFADLEGSQVTSANNDGFWAYVDGRLSLVARKDDPAPGAPEHTAFNSFGDRFVFQAVMTDAGTTGFTGKVRGEDTLFEGLWVGEPTELKLVVHEDMLIGDGVFGGFNAPPVFSHSGAIAFEGEDSRIGETIYKTSNDVLHVVAAKGWQAPGLRDGVVFDGFNAPVISDRGYVAFQASIEGPGVTPDRPLGIWAESASGLRLVARSGDPAPDLPNARFGLTFIGSLLVNSAGETAFETRLDRTAQRGIWSEGGGSLHLVALEGAAAPGTSPGMVFHETFSNTVLNDRGQVAFLGAVIGLDPESRPMEGIWAEDSQGVLHLIALEGQHIEVAPGDIREISDLDFVGNIGNGSSPPYGFNDNGQLVFEAVFEDSMHAIVVSNTVAIPEPSSVVLLILGASVFLRQRLSPLFKSARTSQST